MSINALRFYCMYVLTTKVNTGYSTREKTNVTLTNETFVKEPKRYCCILK